MVFLYFDEMGDRNSFVCGWSFSFFRFHLWIFSFLTFFFFFVFFVPSIFWLLGSLEINSIQTCKPFRIEVFLGQFQMSQVIYRCLTGWLSETWTSVEHMAPWWVPWLLNNGGPWIKRISKCGLIEYLAVQSNGMIWAVQNIIIWLLKLSS